MSYDYSENVLVQGAAGNLLQNELGWNVVYAYNTEKLGKDGTLGSKYEFFHEWKRLAEDDEGRVELETMLRGICKKENFIDLLENFILYDHSDGRTVKILARNHQYLGVNEAVRAYGARALNEGKLGVFWHTQGSGKSYSMLFLAQKMQRTLKRCLSCVMRQILSAAVLKRKRHLLHTHPNVSDL